MNHKKKKQAFSLLEMSVVLLIIAVLILAAIKGSTLINKAKVSSASTITKSSIIPKMEGLVVWYETIMPNSLDSALAYNGSQITSWLDISDNKIDPYDTTISTSGPSYIADGINGLPVLKFNGTSNFLKTTFPMELNSNQLEVFVVAKKSSDVLNSSVAVFYDGSVDNNSTSLVLAIDNDGSGTLRTFRGTNLSSVTNPGSNVSYIFSTSFDGSNNTSYLNGAAGTTVASSGSFSINGIIIGARYIAASPANFFNGFVGELIVFNRTLSTQERNDVLEYLGKKWNIDVTLS
ncbi:MAG: hypothetical protein K0R25_198 [Rickettsiaceae bacterium]|jgi:prepilin-type N-terminal cleavage/methylation domain-containing protein|nr:hypothetical protein [Rickettsiaceae bacterium]